MHTFFFPRCRVSSSCRFFFICLAVLFSASNALPASQAEYLVNIGETAYSSDGSSTWQTFDLNTGIGSGDGTESDPQHLNAVPLVDASGDGTAGLTFSTSGGSAGTVALHIEASAAQLSGDPYLWFNRDSLEQRETFAIANGSAAWTFTFDGFAPENVVEFEFVFARGRTGDRAMTVTHESFGDVLNDAQVDEDGGPQYPSISGLTGDTSYSFQIQPSGTKWGCLPNAVRISVLSASTSSSLSTLIRAPHEGRTVYANTPLKVLVEASAEGTTVDRVDLMVDGVFFASDETAPYSFDLGPAEPGLGSMVLTATTYGNDGFSHSDSVTVERSPLYRGEVYSAAMAHALSRCADMTLSIPNNRYPTELNGLGNWRTETRGWWTNGYWPGLLWMLYGFTGDNYWAQEAADRQAPLEVFNGPTNNHDEGTIVWYAFGMGYHYTGETAYRDIAVTAALNMNALWDPDVGTTRSWSWGSWDSGTNFTTIIDNNMAIELLYAASDWTDNSSWLNHAEIHSLTSIREHVRDDNSTYHIVVFDENTGDVKFKDTHQGYSPDSAWSRGQGWGIYGFTLAYRFTGNPDILEAARDVSDWFIDQTWERPVPPWDFTFIDAIDSNPQDSIAGALAAAGFLELSDYVPEADAVRYREEAAEILDALSAPPYLTTLSGEDSIISYASDNVPENRSVETGILYGDYYYVDALLRYFERMGGGSYELWQGNSFGFATRGQAHTLPEHDGNNDGVPNLWHYLTRTCPTASLPASHRARLPQARASEVGGIPHLEIATQVVEAPGDVLIRVEALNENTLTWETVAVVPEVTPVGNGLLEYAYRVPLVDGRRIARLVAELQ